MRQYCRTLSRFTMTRVVFLVLLLIAVSCTGLSTQTCGPNECSNICGRLCEPSCSTPEPTALTCPKIECNALTRGCRCNDGYYRDKATGRCVCLADCTVPTTKPPGITPPATKPPVTKRPVTKPPVTKPPVTKPPVTKPPVTKPPVTKPPVTKPPVTKPPVTKPPVTKPPVTKPPATKPPVTKPPVTKPPVTKPPVTKPPVTKPPVTKPPVTKPPVTKPPVTKPPVTKPPVTKPPVTKPPVTKPPVTKPPVTKPPVTKPPVTKPPVTKPPVTKPPVTKPPVTKPPVTKPPVTKPPVTKPPVTKPPVTKPPVTKPPVTKPPVTNPPATIPPTTNAPCCGKNEQLGGCGRFCEGTCSKPNMTPCPATICTSFGCQCKSGYLRNEETDLCVPAKECPEKCCKGEIRAACGRMCEGTCESPVRPEICSRIKCVTQSCRCDLDAGYVRNKATGKCVQISQCPPKKPKCPANSAPKLCGKFCEPTCSNPMKRLCKVDPSKCTVDCTCLKGYVRNEKTKQCVKLKNCNC